MSSEGMIFFIGLSIGICFASIAITFERLRDDRWIDKYRLNVLKQLDKLKADVEKIIEAEGRARYKQ